MSTKDNHSFTPIHPHQHNLVRSLNLLDIVMVGIAAMIGGAIFVLTGPAIGLAGSAVIIAFIINAIITLFTAMGYAELGSALPEAGGGYLWVREGLPRPNAFFSGWMSWLAHIIAGSLYAVGFGSFFASFLQSTGILSIDSLFGIIPIDKLFAVIAVAIFAFVNIRGTSETGKIGTVVTMFQLVAIVSIIVAGLWTMANNPSWPANFSDFMPMGLGGLAAAMGLTFIAFEGYEVIVQSGEEVKNPKRNIPRAIFISLALVVLMYCLVAFVSIGAIFPDAAPAWQFIGLNGELGISKAAELFMPYGFFVVLIGGIVSTLAALNATTFSSARVAFAMGRHYNLPHKLSEIHPKFKTPFMAVLLSTLIMAIMAYALPLEAIAQASAVIFLLLFTQVNASVIKIRRMYDNTLDYGFRTPFFPIIPVTGIVLMMGLALYLLVIAPFSWLITVLWALVGFAVYRILTFTKEIANYCPIVTTEGNLSRKDFRILIPYTADDPDRLIKYAIRIAREKDAEINIVRTITIPHQTPLSAGVAFIDSARNAFEPLRDLLNKENVVYHFLLRVSHDTTEAILSTIAEQKINLLIGDYEYIRASNKLQNLITCDYLAIRARRDDALLAVEREEFYKIQQSLGIRKNMVILYDDGDNSNEILRVTDYFANSGNFNLIVVALNRNTKMINEKKTEFNNTAERKEYKSDYLARKEYFKQAGVDFNEIYVSGEIEKDAMQFGKLLLESVLVYNPDLIITESSLGKYSLLSKSKFANLLIYQVRCPVIVVKDVAFPLIHFSMRIVKQITGRMNPLYLTKLTRRHNAK
ncbi:putative amino acid permease YhdG [Candidatus Nitrosocosmicus oleophilus]|uniref:Putative amino acid permease YhdG n=1 Tax=Candidatus Nitrosocosmicus oleophilus TaxID=1353260 RepID=A0A654LY83_9ARCH|nr:amino acid permease [Candidatus Nitrosocosmicus oleophilus]ALI35770.1 putative amino acid permease YhdG [Candidatus Nitrosocosmicus oleophilus]